MTFSHFSRALSFTVQIISTDVSVPPCLHRNPWPINRNKYHCRDARRWQQARNPNNTHLMTITRCIPASTLNRTGRETYSMHKYPSINAPVQYSIGYLCPKSTHFAHPPPGRVFIWDNKDIFGIVHHFVRAAQVRECYTPRYSHWMDAVCVCALDGELQFQFRTILVSDSYDVTRQKGSTCAHGRCTSRCKPWDPAQKATT